MKRNLPISERQIPMTQFDIATIKAMREWVADCCWADLDPEEIAELTDDQIIEGVRLHYDGGLEAFVATCLIYEKLCHA